MRSNVQISCLSPFWTRMFCAKFERLPWLSSLVSQTGSITVGCSCQACNAGSKSQNGGGYWGRSLGNPLFQRGLRRCCAGSRAVLRCTSVGRRVHRCSRIVRGGCTLVEYCTLAPADPWAAARAHLTVPECRFLLPDAKQHSAFSAQSDSGGWTQRRLVVLVGQESTLLRKAHLTYACDATLEVGVATATRRLAGKTIAVLAGTKTTWPCSWLCARWNPTL